MTLFIATMSSRFRRRGTSPSEAEQIRLMKEDLLPFCHTPLALHKFESLAQLAEVYRTLENANPSERRVANSFRRVTTSLEPDLAIRLLLLLGPEVRLSLLHLEVVQGLMLVLLVVRDILVGPWNIYGRIARSP